MDKTTFALVSAGIAVASGFISAALNSWLQGRAEVSSELREARTKLYRVVWKHTEVVSQWPWTAATFADLERLHLTLRDWYYEVPRKRGTKRQALHGETCCPVLRAWVVSWHRSQLKGLPK